MVCGCFRVRSVAALVRCRVAPLVANCGPAPERCRYMPPCAKKVPKTTPYVTLNPSQFRAIAASNILAAPAW